MLFLLLACSDPKVEDTAEPSNEASTEPSNEASTEPSGEPFEPDNNLYAFENEAGDSTVSYSGQIARHAIISSLKAYMSDMGGQIVDGAYVPENVEQVVSDLSFRFDCPEDTCSDLSSGVDNAVQATIGDISTGKNLVGKIAGNDSATDYQDWTDGSSFKGWEGAESPEALVRSWFEDMGAIAFDQFSTGTYALDPAGNAIEKPYITSTGLDYVQLTRHVPDVTKAGMHDSFTVNVTKLRNRRMS